MSNRIFEESVILDADINCLTPQEFTVYFRMIMVADDFGIVPADLDILSKIALLTPKFFRQLSDICQAIVRQNLIREGSHKGLKVYVIKPESWDRIQHYYIRRRKKSKYLHMDADAANEFRARVWESESALSKKMSDNCQTNARHLPDIARASSASENKNTLVEFGKELRSETPESLETQPENLAMSNNRQPVVTLIVDQIKAMGERTGIEAYANISHLSWEYKLRQVAITIGYECLYREAGKFVNWFEGAVESGQVKRTGKHNPLARFLNQWLSRVDPTTYTRDDENWHPDLAEAPESTYHNLTQ